MEKLSRRTMFALPLVALAGSGIISSVAFAGSSGDPKQFMDMFGGPLTTILNNPLPYETKKKKVLSLVDANVDIDGIAQYCLGRYWKKATPAQKTYYLKLFRNIVHHSVVARLNGFNGVRYTLGGVQQQDDGTYVVNSTLSFPDKQPVNVGWVVGYRNNRPQIVDVVGGGASLRLTQRNDYVAYLRRNGGDLDVLLSALRNQVERNEGQAAS